MMYKIDGLNEVSTRSTAWAEAHPTALRTSLVPEGPKNVA